MTGINDMKRRRKRIRERKRNIFGKGKDINRGKNNVKGFLELPSLFLREKH